MNINNRVVGMVVDSVSDVITLAHEQIKPTSWHGHGAGNGIRDRSVHVVGRENPDSD